MARKMLKAIIKATCTIVHVDVNAEVISTKY